MLRVKLAAARRGCPELFGLRAACRQEQRGGSRADSLETLHFIRAGLPAKGGREEKRAERGRKEGGWAGRQAGRR